MHLLTILLALVHIIVGLIGGLIAVPFIGLWLQNDPGGDAGYQSDGRILGLYFLVLFAPSVICGLGLLFRQNWARSVLLLQSLAYSFVWPEGTALAAATLALLLPQQIGRQAAGNRSVSGSAAATVAAPAAAPAGTVRLRLGLNTFLAIAVALSAFDIILTLLFRINEDYVPRELEQGFLPSVIIFPIACLLLLRRIQLPSLSFALPRLRPRRGGTVRKNAARDDLARLARLDADPVIRKYGQLIRADQQWRDEAIAYDRDPTALAACIHLQPIERAMRQAGVPMKLGFHSLAADCCVDPVGLGQVFGLDGAVTYYTMPGDRPYDPEGAGLFCREHPEFRIFVIHPDEAPARIPWFPAAPSPATT